MHATPLPLRPFAVHDLPLVRATAEALEGYGRLVPDYAACPIEIVRWPARGWRPVDSDTGDEGGTTEGIFEFWWRGDMLYGRNGAVGDTYLFGWNDDPTKAREDRANASRERVLLWHANYHPDGGQVFFPRENVPFVVPLALPGDDVTPDKFTAFWFDGSTGLYIHPNVWHEAVFPLAERTSFHDKQGKVHARVSVDFAREFGVYLSVPLRKP